MDEGSFQGQVAVVTGAASGIGRSVAERFAQVSAGVALIDRDESQGRVVCSQNCVCPGITDTPLFHSHVQSTSDPARTLLQRTRRVPLARMLSPYEIADAILYLASERASGITGTELVVDGGYLAAAEGPED
jgi:NAD(P)-dependent dehydrogenase (short-subunit alcohol dehydrogenase family)